MRAMTESEQQHHREKILAVRSALSALRLIGRHDDEDLQVAAARLDNWLTENDKRWVI